MNGMEPYGGSGSLGPWRAGERWEVITDGGGEGEGGWESVIMARERESRALNRRTEEDMILRESPGSPALKLLEEVRETETTPSRREAFDQS